MNASGVLDIVVVVVVGIDADVVCFLFSSSLLKLEVKLVGNCVLVN